MNDHDHITDQWRDLNAEIYHGIFGRYPADDEAEGTDDD